MANCLTSFPLRPSNLCPSLPDQSEAAISLSWYLIGQLPGWLSIVFCSSKFEPKTGFCYFSSRQRISFITFLSADFSFDFHLVLFLLVIASLHFSLFWSIVLSSDNVIKNMLHYQFSTNLANPRSWLEVAADCPFLSNLFVSI